MAAPYEESTRTLRESHWTEERHGDITELCREVFAGTPALRSVAHFSNGILDFLVRGSDRAPLSRLVTVNGEDMVNESLPGCRLLLISQDLDGLLRPLGTGDLMRVVVSNAEGGVWGGRVKPHEFLAALTDRHHGIADADDAMNRLVTRIRTAVYALPDEQPGGDRSLAWSENPRQSPQLRLDFGTAADFDSAEEARLRGLWSRYVTTDDLHYAAYYRDWKLVCVGDVFEDAAVAPRFLNVSVRARRTAYRGLAQSLRGHVTRMTDALGMVVEPPADRLVLDVQEGALYVRWLSPAEFFLGVTLDQRRVGYAEDRLAGLAAAVSPGRGRF